MRRLVTLLSLFALPATAEPVAEAGRFQTFCVPPQACNESPLREVPQQRLTAITSEFEKAYLWLQETGFPMQDSELEGHRDAKGKRHYHLRLRPSKVACQSDPNAKLCVRNKVGDGMYLELPATMVTSDTDFSAAAIDAAHELFHTLQRRATPAGRWLKEATATAVGHAYGETLGWPVDWDNPDYPGRLNQPFHKTDGTGYDQGLYMLAVGKEIGSKNGVAYLKHSLPIPPIKAEDGLKFLYSPHVGKARFDKFFPKFVARMNAPYQHIDPNVSENAWYSFYNYHNLNLETPDRFFSQEFRMRPEAFAAYAMRLTFRSEAHSSGRNEDDLAIVRYRFGDRAGGALHFIAEHDIHEGPTWAHPLYMGGRQGELPFMRIVNAPKQIANAAEPPTSLKIKVEPLHILLPACMKVGKSYPIASADQLDDVSGLSFKAKGAKVDGYRITPTRSGELTPVAVIEDVITRKEHSIRKVRNAPWQIELSSYYVEPDGCAIKLTFPEGGGYAIYDPLKRYTEITGDDGTKIYTADDKVAIWTPGEGWVKLPPEVAAAFAADYAESFTEILNLPASEQDEAREDDHIGRQLPLNFAWTFSSSSIGSALKTLNNARYSSTKEGRLVRKELKKKKEKASPWSKSALKMKSSACPSGGKGCKTGSLRIAGYTVGQITQDKRGRAVTVDFDGTTFQIEYGDFSIGTPPGW